MRQYGRDDVDAVVGRTALDEACYANEAAEQELALLRADAARYRWLRGDGGPASVRWQRWNIQHWTGFWNPVQWAEMDAAVDATMRYDAPPNA